MTPSDVVIAGSSVITLGESRQRMEELPRAAERLGHAARILALRVCSCGHKRHRNVPQGLKEVRSRGPRA